ncbi:PACE efflux transporter [Rhodobacteraceae bacterium RKSG542]|uniref:PACE efflux transporter n=1 Tax=Pseudovibrio flavus TaxID=2529854 RepID=UPI0012BC8766|nr:PACE efflux transporter [Pseudovibrio flavus]MTI17363.1 PACE efflux transporter [Pseudovibrio flavus]
MKTKERIFHSLAFEALLMATLVPLSSILTGHSGSDMLVVSVIMAVIAMIWNYIYNVGFDRLFGAERITRGVRLRALHAGGFEAGLVLITIPMLMWRLKIGFMDALILDIGMVLYVLFYTMVFNWVYDVARHKIKTRKLETQTAAN